MHSLRAFSLRRWLAPLARLSTPRPTTRLRVVELESRDNPAPVPAVSIGIAADPFIGQQNVPASVTFANTGTDPGFGPWTYVVLPRSGADGNPVNDGISYVPGSATFLSAAITGDVYTSTGTSVTPTGPAASYALTPAGTTVTITGLSAGDQVVFFQLPYISFAQNQPNATVRFLTNVSNQANLNAPLTLRAGGGFTLGTDALNNPVPDPPMVASAVSQTVRPELIRLSKTYIGPEQETATGPNYTRQYRIDARVAPGQSITSFQLRDLIDAGMQYRPDLGVTTAVNGGSFLGTLGTTATATQPGGTIVGNFTQVTGDASPTTVDASLTFSFFVPRNESGGTNVLPLTTGAFQTLTDRASAEGDWTNPFDANDPALTTASAYWTDPIRTPVDVITAKSVAVQKGVTVVGGGSAAQNAVLEYTIDFQISDYFAFDQFNLPDLLPDGVRFLGGFTPTLLVTQPNGPTFGGNFGGGNFDVGGVNGDGTQSLNFNVSGQLGGSGRLIGGWIGAGGTGGPVPDTSTFGNQFSGMNGPATGRIVFRAQVQNTYSVLGGGTNVKQGDSLTNIVPTTTPPGLPGGTQPAGGRVLDYADAATPTGSQRADNTAATVVIPTGVLTKTIYAVNGQLLNGNPPPRLQNGDVVTYRLTYLLPTSSAQNFRITDYLPLPVFDATDVTTGNWAAPRGSTPAAGSANYGPGDGTNVNYGDGTISGQSNPAIATDATANTVQFQFPTILQDNQQRTTFVDLLFSVAIQDVPFADGFPLTNQANAREGNTPDAPSESDQINQVSLGRPNLTVTKGVVGTNRSGFGPFGSGGVTFNGPGAATSFTGTLTSNGLSANPINSNLTGIDAVDRVQFGVVVENTGSGHRGAFDVVVSDTIPTGFTTPAGGRNLQLRDGTGAGGSVANAITAGYLFFDSVGNPLTTQAAVETAFFSAGGVRVSGGPTAANAIGDNGGVLDPYSGTSGRNLLVVTYDLETTTSVAPNQNLVNTATVSRYAAVPGGTDETPTNVGDLDDDASVRIALPRVTKALVGTEFTAPGNNAGNQATVGELVTYTLTVRVPEGTTPGATIIDSLQAGLAFVDVQSVSFSAGLSATTPPGTGTNPANVAITSNGRVATFTLGTLTNSNTDDSAAETITITYRAVVLNTNTTPPNNGTNLNNNQGGATRNNSAEFEWTNNTTTLPGVPAGQATDASGALTGTATPVTVVEPTLTNAKDVAVQPAGVGAYSAFGQSVRADAGDNLRYRITFANPAGGSTTAYDVSLSDQLPTAAFVGGASAFSLLSVTVTGAGTVYRDGAVHTLTAADFTINGSGLLELNTAFNYDLDPDVSVAVVVEGVNFRGTTGSQVANVADVRWTSLDATPGQRSVHNTNSVERTGAGGEIGGGALNDYRDTDNAVIESPPVARKDLVASSETHTAGTNVTVGEVVRYRVYVSLPEGTAANFQVRDFLPTGLRFLNDGTARFALISTGGAAIASANSTNGDVLALTGGALDGSTALLVTLPSSSITGTFGDGNVATAIGGAGTGEAIIYASGQDVFFRFGNLSNTDNDADAEYVVIEFNALVENIAAVQAGGTLANTVGVLVDTNTDGTPGYIDVVADANGDGLGSGEATGTATDPANDGSGTPALSNAVTVTVVEPNVQVTKTAIGPTSGDPGDTITFEIVLTSNGTATAFDLQFSDLVPGGFENVTFVGGSLATGGTVTGLGTVTVIGNTVTLSAGSMAVGGTITFRITATINDNGVSAPTPGSTLTNTGGVTWTSLPGGGGTTPNGTGSATPGAAGTGTGERTGADGEGGPLNDHADTDPENVTVNSHALNGLVYYDANNNGVRDGGEALITGQSIRLRLTGTDVAGNAVDLTVTTTTGSYSFTGLRAGTYTVTQLDQPTGYLDGRDTPGTSSPGTPFGGSGTAATDDRGTPISPLRDADAVATVVIGGGPDNRTGVNYNFGELLPAQLGNRVWEDANANGVQDGGETGVDGAVVVLTGTDDTGRAVAVTLTTTGGGNYQFTGLRPGTYTATFTAPSGYAHPPNRGGNDATDSDAGSTFTPGTSTAPTGTYTLTAGQDDPTVDAGVYRPVSLGNRVYFDQDADGVQDPNEPGLPGATVEVVWLGSDGLPGGGDDLTFTTTTGANGLWTVGNLPPGTYRVTVTPPAGGPWTLTDSIDNAALSATNGITVNTPSGTDRTDLDFGYRGSGNIGDTIFLDIDNDGVADGGEGIQNVQVILTADIDGDGDTDSFTATTNASGVYQFTNLPFNTPVGNPITYTVTVNTATLPPGVTQSFDPDGTLNNNSTTVLSAGALSDPTRDFGYRGPGSIGDTVWLDVNGNNTFDTGEGIANVVVRLTGDFDNNGVTETVTATTDTNGQYLFSGLLTDNGAGGSKTYTVDVDETTLPASVNTTPVIDPQGPLDGTATSTLSTGSPTDLTRDFAYRGNGSLGDTVWIDVNGNGTFDSGEGIAGVEVSITGDLDGDGTLETVRTTTDTNGQYLFNGLRTTAGGITYTVAVNTTTLPTGVVQFFDPDATLDASATATLSTGTPTDLTRDFGYRGPGSIGDRVFNDINNNGQWDAGEGLDGVTVTITGDFDNDGANETVTTTTTADGFYLFNGLVVDGDNGAPVVPKTYTVTVVSATLPATLAQSFDPDGTSDNQSNSTLSPGTLSDLTRDFGYRGPGSVGDTIFLDVNNDGLPSSGEGIANVVVRLVGDFDGDGVAETVTATTDTNGQYTFTGLRTTAGGVTYTVDVDETTLPTTVNTTPTTDPQGPFDGTAAATLTNAAPTDLTRDFGYRGVGSIGDTIFLDVNASGAPDAGEGLAGVRVFLTGDLDGDGVVETVTTTTNASGVYQFGGLRTTPGGVPYTVTIDTTTLPQDGLGQPIPNTVDPDGGTSNTSLVTLTDAAANNQAQDFGYRNTVNGIIGDTVFLDVDGDGTADPGEGITGVRVTLTADIDGNGTTETFTATTNANGTYRFENLPVRNPFGTLIQYTVTVNTGGLPLGVTNTADPDGGNDDTSTLTLNPAAPVNLNQDFGYQGDGSIGDRVFLDLNNNGQHDPGEGITGVRVTLTADVNGDGVQDLTVTATTGADGEYLFDNLPVTLPSEGPISYTVRVTSGLPTGVGNTVDPDGVTDSRWTGTLAVGPAAPDRRDIDFGYRGTAMLGDRVWLDANGDRVQDLFATEPGLPNVGLTLIYAGQDGVFGNADDITTALTANANGVYLFTGLPAGTFRVTVNTATLPANVAQTHDLNGIATPHAADAALTTGQVRTDVDFGYRGAASVGDRVWLDGNRNGVQDAGEGGIPGAVVQLQLAGRDGLLGTADDFLLTTTTGANGVYLFDGLPVYGRGTNPFRMTVLSVPAPGILPVSDLDSAVGAGDTTSAAPIGPTENRRDVDFGYAGVGSISGNVFEDRNNDGVRQPDESGIPGTVLVLEGTDVYGNPVRDPLSGGPLTTTADADGNYAFTNLPAGFYVVREVQPAGFLDGTDTPGSLGGVAGRGAADTDRITQITLPAGTNSANNNFAEIRPAAVAGSVYEDRNANGVQDANEPGIPGVRVTLTGTDDRGPVALTTTTDANGNYAFGDLRPGTYTLTQTQPTEFAQGQNSVGTGGGALGTTDVIQSITLVPGQRAVEYRFGEVVTRLTPVPALTVEPVHPWETSKRMFLSSTTTQPTLSVPNFAALGGVSTTRQIQFVATGDGEGGSRVRVFDLTNGVERFRFNPFPGFRGGVRTAVGDVTGDGIPDIIAAAGPGGTPHVKVYDGDTGVEVWSYLAYETAFAGGMFVAAGDLDGDGRAEVITGADRSGGPRVRVFRSGDPNQVLCDFYGIEDASFRGGVRVAVGDVNADGRADLVCAAGEGGGPRVAVYDGRAIAQWQPTRLVWDFYAFPANTPNGAYVAVADVDGDGFADVIAGAGEGSGPRVTTYSGRELVNGRYTVLTDGPAFDPSGNVGGARVAALDVDGDGLAEIFAGTGPGVRPVARFFNPRTGAVLNTFSPDWANEINGVFVG